LQSIIRLVVALAVVVFAGAAFAQSYPDRPVRLIVPFAPGGPTDVVARIIADKLSQSLGKQFYAENRAGAGGNIGMGQAAAAPADGYTILFVSSSFVVARPLRQIPTIPTRTAPSPLPAPRPAY
jgi:tripartite-type tricarboxylate transporter receptor subunit TctC